ncbi:NifB/NifX family molybdenum-iron cluster-binding protein [Salinispira pacifica]
MKIAVTAEEDRGLESAVAQHFGHAAYFLFVDVDAGKIIAANGVANPFAEGHAPGQIPGFVHEQGAEVILSGGMGGRAVEFFRQKGITAATGAAGTVRQAIETYLAGGLSGATACDESVEHGHG